MEDRGHLKCAAYVQSTQELVLVAATAEISASHRSDVGNGTRVPSAVGVTLVFSALTFIQKPRFEGFTASLESCTRGRVGTAHHHGESPVLVNPCLKENSWHCLLNAALSWKSSALPVFPHYTFSPS